MVWADEVVWMDGVVRVLRVVKVVGVNGVDGLDWVVGHIFYVGLF